MMDWTDRHCRTFHRLLAPSALLYTEMVTTGALLRGGDPARFLRRGDEGAPVALQLGGSGPDDLGKAAALAGPFGYDEVNLNCGCPSPRVRRGAFGAALMAEPERVARAVEAMRAATPLPVTVKCRIAVDEEDPEIFLDRFVDPVADAGCRVFIVHARKAWLNGLSPKANRTVPPLDYDRVRRLKARRPDLCIVLNGGLRDPNAAARAAKGLDGAMIGREAYENPWSLPGFAAAFDGPSTAPELEAVARALRAYAAAERDRGVPVKDVYRHALGLANGKPGARAFRRHLSEAMRDPNADPAILTDALERLAPVHAAPQRAGQRAFA